MLTASWLPFVGHLMRDIGCTGLIKLIEIEHRKAMEMSRWVWGLQSWVLDWHLTLR